MRAGYPPLDYKKGGKTISKQPIVFNVQYMPYRLPSNATAEQRAKHESDRAFFDMSGDKNIFDYITTEGKRTGKFTALDYFQKNTGVFNGNGMISKEEVEAMKKRAQTGEKNLWHGFISLDEENSHRIDDPAKCIHLVKRNFGQFFRDMGLDPTNVDIMCALHLDRPTHLHIHFLFWEKEPKCKYRKKELEYRHKGKIAKDVLDKMHVRLSLFLADDKEQLPKTRGQALRELESLATFDVLFYSEDEIRKEVLALAKELPKNARYAYGAKDMIPYRERIDRIVHMLIMTDKRAIKANRKFYEALTVMESKVKKICKGNIAEENIKVIDEIKQDYKRRQGNYVLKAVVKIKPEIFERKPRRKYKVNDNALKRSIGISDKIVGKLLEELLAGFADECESAGGQGKNRLREIEEEIEQAREEANKKSGSGSGSGWSK